MKVPLFRLFLSFVLLTSCLALADQGARKQSKNNRPVAYPATARQMHLAGTVRLEVLIGASGKVKKVDVVGGNPVLAAAAVDAVRDWTWEPAPADTTESVIIKFDQQ